MKVLLQLILMLNKPNTFTSAFGDYVSKQCLPDQLAGGHFYRLLDTLTPDNVGLCKLNANRIYIVLSSINRARYLNEYFIIRLKKE